MQVSTGRYAGGILVRRPAAMRAYVSMTMPS